MPAYIQGLQGVAIAERAYQQAVSYARERVQGTVPGESARVTIIHHPDVRRMLMLMRAQTEAMRAVAYLTGAALDHAHHAENPEERTRYQARVALLTPVVKAWCSEVAQEVTSLGVQVHGGMGYIEETGCAQYFRDGRIITIYEGTTGIQAGDLVGRKILRDGGAAMRALLAEMEQFESALSELTDSGYSVIRTHFSNGRKALSEATDWLLKHGSQATDAPGSVAVNLLMLMGVVMGGWQMARAALVASRRLKAGAGDSSFFSAKLITARFYAEHIMPRTAAYLSGVLAGSDSIMGLEEEQF